MATSNAKVSALVLTHIDKSASRGRMFCVIDCIVSNIAKAQRAILTSSPVTQLVFISPGQPAAIS